LPWSKLLPGFPEVVGEMFRKLGFLVVVAVMVTTAARPAWSGTASGAISGAISGYVRDGSGAPQMGAAVEILGSAAHALKVFTDDRGFYSVASLLPGTYSVKVSAPSFLPSLRDKISVRAGAKLMVTVTLTTSWFRCAVRWTMTTGNGRCAQSPTGPFCACLKMARL
jgi:hypothetical protein